MASTKTKYRRTTKNKQISIQGLSKVLTKVENPVTRTDLPVFHPGDTVRVHVRIKEGDKERAQAYEGIVISRKGGGASKSFIVRKISHGVGVERIFMESSPKIAKLEVIQAGKVRRAKLYYLRGLQGKAARVEREIGAESAAAPASAATAAASAKK